jgi:hypothetical protein
MFSGTYESRARKKGALNSDPLCGVEKNGAVLPLFRGRGLDFSP